MQDTSFIRMAALLYSETEGIKKKSTVLKKVVETVFLELNNIELSQSEIQLKIQELLNIYVSNEEISEVLETGKGRQHFVRVGADRSIKYVLDSKRYNRLEENRRKSIENYIDEFIFINDYAVEVKEIIYQYIYHLFKRNIADFSKILGGKMQIDPNMNQSFTSDELNVIKQFIDWDNSDKNEAILELMGCSLEYSMLVSDNAKVYGTRLGNIFSNKIIYIDTNIIYYCLGINGEEYRIANEMLLEKCKKAKEQLRITKITEQEFTNTLNHYIEEIKKYESTSLQRVYEKYIHNKDVYLFYLEWKKQRTRFNTPEYFKKDILIRYNQWIKKYDVFVDRKEPYDNESQFVKDKIAEYSTEILYKGSINYDAINMYWIECLREKESFRSGFSEEKYFVLSPHKVLKRWDAEKRRDIPMIVTPELWMTLLTRFITRSEDDYKSFINFINIKVPNEDGISNKEFYAIVKVIEEITSDINHQETIIDALIDEKFAYLDKKPDEEMSLEELTEKTKERAENILSDKIAMLETQVGVLTNQVKEAGDRYSETEEKSKKTTNELMLSEREKSAEIYAKDKLLEKRIRHIGIAVVLLGLLLWQLIDFFVMKNQKNIVWCTVETMLLNTPLEEVKTDVFITIGSVIISFVCLGCCAKLFQILYSPEKINGYVEKMKKKFYKKREV